MASDHFAKCQTWNRLHGGNGPHYHLKSLSPKGRPIKAGPLSERYIDPSSQAAFRYLLFDWARYYYCCSCCYYYFAICSVIIILFYYN